MSFRSSISRPKPLEQRFLALVERNGPRIRRLCRAWSGTLEVADLEAEVFLQLWQSLPSFEGRSSEDTWVYRVTLNTVMGLVRRERNRAEEPLPETEVRAPETALGGDRLLIQEQRIGSVRRALRQLHEADRVLITLWLEELSYQEIARIVGSNENHVGVRIHRAKKRLAQLLGESGGGETLVDNPEA